MVAHLALQQLLQLAVRDQTSSQARAISSYKINELETWINTQIKTADDAQKAHLFYGSEIIKRFKDDPDHFKKNTSVKMPDGSPIGMKFQCNH